jgi:hypothetical protein
MHYNIDHNHSRGSGAALGNDADTIRLPHPDLWVQTLDTAELRTRVSGCFLLNLIRISGFPESGYPGFREPGYADWDNSQISPELVGWISNKFPY